MLHIKNLCLNTPNFSLKNIDIDLPEGEYLVLLGRSGSGKTLLLETIAGRYPLSRGEIYIDGENVTRRPPEQRKIGFVYQNYELFPHFNVYENISFPLRLKNLPGEEIQEKVLEIEQNLNIEYISKRQISELSGGEKQRVAIGRALSVCPKLLFLDEPFSALDYMTKNKVKHIMKEVCKIYKMTVIHVTHDISEALFFASKIGIVKQGEITNYFDVDDRLLKKEEDFFYEYL